MKISIAVHGRFHAFELASALLRADHDVHLLTNARRAAVTGRFPLERTELFRRHFVLAHAARMVSGGEPPPFMEARLKQMFGRWAARRHIELDPDVIHCWSGVAEESLHACRDRCTGTMARGSAHIAVQRRLLQEEEARIGRPLEQPSQWIVEREEREYAAAQVIVVPSAFARESFVDRGVSANRLAVVPLATRADGFEAAEGAIAARIKRLRAGSPLRVLYVGTLSYRKGMHDMLEVIRRLHGKMEFHLVGPVLPECEVFVRDATKIARIDAAVPETSLPAVYARGDVFLLPTIEDGFAVVLAQAQAAGLPIITTTNSGGPDIIADGGQGFVVPIRAPDLIVERLLWCDDNREQLAQMVDALHSHPPRRNWDDVASDFMKAVTV